MAKKGLSRRDFLRLGTIAAAGGVLGACAPKATEAPAEEPAEGQAEEKAPAPVSEKPPVTISYWVFWTQYGDCVPLFEEAFQEFVAPNKVEIKWAVNADEVFLTNVAAGTPPDVGASSRYDNYITRDQVVPIDDMVATSDIISPDKFIEGNWVICGYKGKQYGVPAIECFVRRGMNYNERLVAEAGLDPDNPPETWEETFEWHEKLTKFDDAGNLLQIGLDPFDAEGGQLGGNDGSFPPESWGFEYFDVDTGKFNLDHEKMAAAFETMADFIRLVGPDNLAGLRAVEGQGTWGGAYNAEVQAMIIEGYWHPGETAHEKPEVSAVNRATWVPVPEERRGAKIQFGGGHMVMFFKDAVNPIQDAWPVAEFLQSDIHCDSVFKTIGWLPAYKSYIQGADASAFPGLDFYFKSIDEATEMHNAIRNPIASFVSQTWTELRERVYRDEMTGKEAAAKFQQDCEQEWDEAGFA